MFAAPAQFTLSTLVLAPAGLVAGAATTTRCAITYYDSADLVLAGYDMVVRRHGDGTWTLDHPDGQVRRFAEAGDDVPDSLRDLLHTQLRSRALLPVICLTSDRAAIEVSPHAGAPVALVVHDAVTAVRGTEEVCRFGIVELSGLAPDTSGVMQRLTDALTTAACTTASHAHQLRRAFGILSPPGPAPHAPLPDRPRTAPLHEFLAPILGASLERLSAHDVGVRIDADIEDVHQLRVATRRLRADLRALQSTLDRHVVTQLRAELGWLASLAGPVRDADVLLARLTAAVSGLTGDDAAAGAALCARLSSERAGHRDALVAGMRTPRYDALLDALTNVVSCPPVRSPRKAGRPASAVLGRATVRQWHALLAVVAGLGDNASIAQLHQVRIAAKHLRYTAESAAPALGKPAARIAAKATRIQTTLGDLHDAIIAGLWLREAAADDASVAVVAERLAEGEDAAAERLRAGWKHLWKKVRPKARADITSLAKRASIRV